MYYLATIKSRSSPSFFVFPNGLMHFISLRFAILFLYLFKYNKYNIVLYSVFSIVFLWIQFILLFKWNGNELRWLIIKMVLILSLKLSLLNSLLLLSIKNNTFFLLSPFLKDCFLRFFKVQLSFSFMVDDFVVKSFQLCFTMQSIALYCIV